jgi:hypothetical protein
MGIGIAGMEGIPDAPAMLGMGGIPGVDGILGIGGLDGIGGTLEPAPACGPTPGGMAGMFGIGGIPGAPDIFGIVGWEGIGGMAGVVCDCGPMPGGSPPGGIGIPGIPGAPTEPISVAGFKCTKLRLFGKSSVIVPELMSRMSTGLGQFVAVISTRIEFVPTV